MNIINSIFYKKLCYLFCLQPAAIEDLRKWTSTEALGDVTVTPDCMHHVDTLLNTSNLMVSEQQQQGVTMVGGTPHTPRLATPSIDVTRDTVDALSPSSAHMDTTNTTNTMMNNNSSQTTPNNINNDVPLNHRLPSPEEQCKIIALR